ncbi:MAG: hypothetical protein AAF402_08755 [Pseudomonadota bacterium]
MDNRFLTVTVLTLTLVAPVSHAVQNLSVSGSIGFENRFFPDRPLFLGQLQGSQTSVVSETEFSWESENGSQQLGLTPFFRIDNEDRERTHFDIREAYWRFLGDEFEFTAGVDRVFWGVTESSHLVNIINQVDGVENVDQEDYLGQPMLASAWQKDYGRFEAFILPFFRERTFAGVDGRLRAPLVVDTSDPVYESGREDRRLDIALRYSHYFGNWDVGLSLFHGTSREPRLLPSADGSTLIPHYDVINQFGIDIQYTGEAWLWKLEAIAREGQGDTFGAMVGGFEYSFYQVFDSDKDVGILMEYLYDDRDDSAPLNVFQDDLFFGTRLAFNDAQDTALLAGAIVDLEDQTTSLRLEAERRLGQSWKIEIEAQILVNEDERNPVNGFASDDFLLLSLAKYF